MIRCEGALYPVRTGVGADGEPSCGGAGSETRRIGGVGGSENWSALRPAAQAIQEALRARLVPEDRLGSVRSVGGADVAYDRSRMVLCAAVAVHSYPELDQVAAATVVRPIRFSYRPGFLGFREAPPIAEAVRQLEPPPELLLVEGHGTAHPRRFGAACHVGVLTDLPSVGVAKNRLVGRYADVPEGKGAWVPLIDAGDVVGAVLRTREGVKPVYVSPGHRVGLETAVEHTLICCRGYRMPEPIRRAHQLAREGLTREV